ncbi:hypothetical protein ABZV75_24215 [Streptomyces flaveolus]|uniref:hypothetical protein n=1 Tax=Streptomyces flaveolus TaxID=67297 RepID=UPI0033BEB6F6
MRTGAPVRTDRTAANAIPGAARASSPVTDGLRAVRTLSAKSAGSAIPAGLTHEPLDALAADVDAG